MRKLLDRVLIVATAIATIVIGIICNKNVWAEGNVATSMFVSPMSQRVLLTPGETYEGTIMISNSNMAKADLHYELSVGAYNVIKSDDSKDDYGDVNIVTRSNMNIMTDWILFRDDAGTIKPNDSIEVPFYIDVPLDAPAGAQYATILVTDVGNINPKEGDLNIGTNLRIASTIYANVAGETIKKGTITDNSIPTFLTTGPLEATSMVRNNGNVYTDAEYILQVWPMFSDEEICTNEEKPDTSLVLPDTERYHMQSCDLTSIGIFRAKQTVKIFGEESIVEKTVIVCPIWLLFLIIFVIIAIIIWLVLRIKSRGKQTRKTVNTTAE